jgi:hypothetical protein
MLVAVAALDLIRCGLVMVAVRDPGVGRRAGRGRPGRSSAERQNRTRVPGRRPALGGLGSIADRRRVGAAGPQRLAPLRDPVYQ